MILAVDAGNTRIKWGLHVPHSGVLHAPSFDEQDWQQLGAVPTALANELGERWQALPSKPDHVVISNVAGEATRAALATALRVVASAAKTVRWLSASRSECGISNLYEQPERLGSDRWAALIGAWRRHHGAALVVNCGTATTVDRLSAAGEFRGGLILPGVELMKKSLMKHTANLGLSAGRFQAEPRNTADAIESGAACRRRPARSSACGEPAPKKS